MVKIIYKSMACILVFLLLINIFSTGQILAQSTPVTVGSYDTDSGTEKIKILGIDSTAYPKIKVNIFVDELCAATGNLVKDDFTVEEDGTRVAIDNFYFTGKASGQKLDLAVVFDETDTMADEIKAMKSNVDDLTNKIKASDIDARYSLVSFENEVMAKIEWTADPEVFKREVNQLRAYGGFYKRPEDSLGGVAKALSFGFRPDAQKIIIVITDEPSMQRGDGWSNSTYHQDDVLQDLIDAGVMLVAVSPDFRSRSIPSNIPRSDLPLYADMRELAQNSGGLWINIYSADFSVILDQLEDIITGTYVIEYTSPTTTTSGSRTVSVSLNAPDCIEGIASSTYMTAVGNEISSLESDHLIRVLGIPSNVKYSVAFSSDGLILASGNKDGTVTLWDVTSGAEIETLEGHSNNVVGVAFSPDGQTLVSADHFTLILWDVSSGMAIQTLVDHNFSVCLVTFSPDGRVMASSGLNVTSVGLNGYFDQGILKLWDVANITEIRTLEGLNIGNSIAYSPDSLTLALSGLDGRLTLWDVASGEENRTLIYDPYKRVECVAFSPDGQTIASGDNYGSITLSDVTNANEIWTLHGDDVSVKSVAFSPDGSILAYGGYLTLQLWDVANGTKIWTLESIDDNPESRSYMVAFSPNGQTLASASFDGTVKLWNVASGAKIRELGNPYYEVSSVDFSPDGKTVVSRGGYNSMTLWDIATGAEVWISEGTISERNLTCYEISPDGNTLASGINDGGTLKLWDVTSGEEIWTIERTKFYNPIKSVAFSPDSSTLASGSYDGTVKLWDVASGKEIWSTQMNNFEIWYEKSVAFSPDGQTIAAILINSTDLERSMELVKFWDVASGVEIRTLEGQPFLEDIVLSPDGRSAALIYFNKTMLLAVASGEVILNLEGRRSGSGTYFGRASGVAFSTDGRIFGSSVDNKVKLWNVANGFELRTLEGHSGNVTDVAFSPDGQTLVSASVDKTVKLWSVASGEEIRTLEGHDDWVTSVAFSPDGRTLASGSNDGTIRLWRVA